MSHEDSSHIPDESHNQIAEDLLIVLTEQNAQALRDKELSELKEQYRSGEIGAATYHNRDDDIYQMYAIGPERRRRAALDRLNNDRPIKRLGRTVVNKLFRHP